MTQSLLSEFLRGVASQHGARLAVCKDGRQLSYGQLQEAIDCVAERLRSAGIGHGHLVAMDFENGPDYIITLFGVLAADATCVPLHAALSTPEKEDIVRAAGVDCVLQAAAVSAKYTCPVFSPFDDGSAPLPGHVPMRPGRELADAAIILYTSGSTGAPKGVVLSHAGLLLNALLSAQTLQLRYTDRVLVGVPFSHAYGQNRCVLSPLFSAAAIICPREHSIQAMQTALHEHEITLVVSVPSTYAFLLNVRVASLPHLRGALSGAAPLPPTIQQRFTEKFGVPLLTAYGATETSPVIASQRIDEAPCIGTVGKPLPGIVIDIRSAPDEPGDAPVSAQGAGRCGELFVKGHNVMLGYWDGSRPARDCLSGWYATGDIVSLDEEGNLRVLGRKSDMIKKLGYRIFPAEIEIALLRHPAINDCLVQKKSNSFSGDDIQALIVINSDRQVTEIELADFCRTQLAEYKVPSKFMFVTEIAVTATGKPRRTS